MWTNVRIGGQAAFDKAYSQQGGTFADDSFVKAGDALKQLIDLKPFQDGFLGHTYGDADKVFANKQAAIELMGQWELGSQKDNSPDKQGLGADLGWFPFPMIEGGAGDPNDAMGGGNGWAVGKNAPAEAIDFLKALTSKDEQCGEAKIGLGVPVVKGSETCITDPIMQTIQQTVAKAKYFQLYYDQFLPAAPAAASNDAVQELFAGTKTSAEVAKLVQDAYAAEIKK
jgi:raffinose/stachyose/melibiose transport system substrate-binding protein